MTSAGTVPVPEGVTLRRWLVPDPMSEKYYGISPYAYCGGDPVNLVDPARLYNY